MRQLSSPVVPLRIVCLEEEQAVSVNVVNRRENLHNLVLHLSCAPDASLTRRVLLDLSAPLLVWRALWYQ